MPKSKSQDLDFRVIFLYYMFYHEFNGKILGLFDGKISEDSIRDAETCGFRFCGCHCTPLRNDLAPEYEGDSSHFRYKQHKIPLVSSSQINKKPPAERKRKRPSAQVFGYFWPQTSDKITYRKTIEVLKRESSPLLMKL